MAKLAIIFDDTISKEGSHLTNYCKLMSDLTTDEKGKKCYQRVQLKHFKRAMHDVREQYLCSVTNVCKNVEEKFSDIKKPTIFENIKSILDTFTSVLTEIRVFLEMIPSKNSVSILRSFSLRTATESPPNH